MSLRLEMLLARDELESSSDEGEASRRSDPEQNLGHRIHNMTRSLMADTDSDDVQHPSGENGDDSARVKEEEVYYLRDEPVHDRQQREQMYPDEQPDHPTGRTSTSAETNTVLRTPSALPPTSRQERFHDFRPGSGALATPSPSASAPAHNPKQIDAMQPSPGVGWDPQREAKQQEPRPKSLGALWSPFASPSMKSTPRNGKLDASALSNSSSPEKDKASAILLTKALLWATASPSPSKANGTGHSPSRAPNVDGLHHDSGGQGSMNGASEVQDRGSDPWAGKRNGIPRQPDAERRDGGRGGSDTSEESASLHHASADAPNGGQGEEPPTRSVFSAAWDTTRNILNVLSPRATAAPHAHVPPLAPTIPDPEYESQEEERGSQAVKKDVDPQRSSFHSTSTLRQDQAEFQANPPLSQSVPHHPRTRSPSPTTRSDLHSPSPRLVSEQPTAAAVVGSAGQTVTADFIRASSPSIGPQALFPTLPPLSPPPYAPQFRDDVDVEDEDGRGRGVQEPSRGHTQVPVGVSDDLGPGRLDGGRDCGKDWGGSIPSLSPTGSVVSSMHNRDAVSEDGAEGARDSVRSGRWRWRIKDAADDRVEEEKKQAEAEGKAGRVRPGGKRDEEQRVWEGGRGPAAISRVESASQHSAQSKASEVSAARSNRQGLDELRGRTGSLVVEWAGDQVAGRPEVKDASTTAADDVHGLGRDTHTTVFVSDLWDQMDDRTLREFFEDCGEIREVTLHKDAASGEYRGRAQVELAQSGAAQTADRVTDVGISIPIEMLYGMLYGQSVRIDYALPKSEIVGGGNGASSSAGVGAVRELVQPPTRDGAPACDTDKDGGSRGGPRKRENDDALWQVVQQAVASMNATVLRRFEQLSPAQKQLQRLDDGGAVRRVENVDRQGSGRSGGHRPVDLRPGMEGASLPDDEEDLPHSKSRKPVVNVDPASLTQSKSAPTPSASQSPSVAGPAFSQTPPVRKPDTPKALKLQGDDPFAIALLIHRVQPWGESALKPPTMQLEVEFQLRGLSIPNSDDDDRGRAGTSQSQNASVSSSPDRRDTTEAGGELSVTVRRLVSSVPDGTEVKRELFFGTAEALPLLVRVKVGHMRRTSSPSEVKLRQWGMEARWEQRLSFALDRMQANALRGGVQGFVDFWVDTANSQEQDAGVGTASLALRWEDKQDKHTAPRTNKRDDEFEIAPVPAEEVSDKTTQQQQQQQSAQKQTNAQPGPSFRAERQLPKPPSGTAPIQGDRRALQRPLRCLEDQNTVVRTASPDVQARKFHMSNNLRQRPVGFVEDDAEATVVGGQQALIIVRTCWIVALAVTDCAMVFTFQIFWGLSDFLCSGYGASSPVIATTALFAVVVGLHLFDVVMRILRKDHAGKVIGWRYFTGLPGAKKRAGSGGPVMHTWDTIIILISIALIGLHVNECQREDKAGSWTYTVIRRLHLVVHCARCLTVLAKCSSLRDDWRKAIQTAVSQSKRRFIDADSEFDLDLCYIYDRVIAMALPVVDGAVYRNDIHEVARFVATRHYGHFLVFNLCEHHEESGNGNYDCQILYDQVIKIPFRDHNAPQVNVLLRFCEQASEWLDRHPSNVVIVHCQGGKGRTGTFCSALALWTGRHERASEALEEFCQRRTDHRRSGPEQRVVAPSQLRCLSYVQSILMSTGQLPPRRRVMLQSVMINTRPFPDRDVVVLGIVVESCGRVEYDGLKHQGLIPYRATEREPENDSLVINTGNVLLCDDVCVRVYMFDEDALDGHAVSVTPLEEDSYGGHRSDSIGNSKERAASVGAVIGKGGTTVKFRGMVGKEFAFITFHSAFCPVPKGSSGGEASVSMTFDKSEIDGVYSKRRRGVSSQFQIVLAIRDPSNDVLATPKAITPAAKPVPPSRLGQQLLAPPPLPETDAPDNAPPAVFKSQVGRGGMPPAVRSAFLRQSIWSTVTRVCTNAERFELGAVIYRAGATPGVRTLFFVEGGVVRQRQRQLSEEQYNQKSNGKVLREFAEFCAGDWFGDMEFLLGYQEEDDEAEFIAYSSDGAVIRKIQTNVAEQKVVPIALDGLDASEVSLLLEGLCMELAVRCAHIFDRTAMAHTSLTCVKRDTGVGLGQQKHKMLAQKIAKQMDLPVTSQMFCVARSTLHDDDRRHAGKVVVFSRHLIFRGTRTMSGRHQIRIPIEGMLALHVSDRSLDIVMVAGSKDRVACELQERTTVRRSAGRSSKPATQSRMRRQSNALKPRVSGEMDEVQAPSSPSFALQELRKRWSAVRRPSEEGGQIRRTSEFDDGLSVSPDGEEASPDAEVFSFSMSSDSACAEVHQVLRERIKEIRGAAGAQHMAVLSRSSSAGDDAAAGSETWLQDSNEQFGRRFGYVLRSECGQPETVQAMNHLFANAHTSSFRHGDVIIQQGSTERRLYHIVCGTVIFKSAEGQVLVRLGPGEIFGKTSFLESGNRGSNTEASAEGDVTTVELNHDIVQMLSALDPNVGRFIYRSLAVSAASRVRGQLKALHMLVHY